MQTRGFCKRVSPNFVIERRNGKQTLQNQQIGSCGRLPFDCTGRACTDLSTKSPAPKTQAENPPANSADGGGNGAAAANSAPAPAAEPAAVRTEVAPSATV